MFDQKEYMHHYQKANRERLNEYARQHRAKKRARYNEVAKNYRDRNRDLVNERRSATRLIGGLLSPKDYDDILAAQGGVCAICCTPRVNKTSPGHTRRRILCVDHNHNTNRVRGLLCHRSNSAIGLLEDDPVRIAAALRYLKDKE
jgi:hypothetical protein